MSDKIKRPPSVWLAQIMLGLFTLLCFAILVISLTTPSEGGSGGGPTVRGMSILFGTAGLLLVSLWGLAKRKAYGRWLGLLSLILEWVFILYAELSREEWPQEQGHLVFVIIFHGLLHVLVLTLIFRLAFAKGVKAFFRRGVEPA